VIARLGPLVLIVGRSLRQHALSTTVTVLSTALATGLVVSVFSVSARSRDAFEVPRLDFDAVVGARGSPLQLVLNAVFHLETSPGNLPWSVYEELAADPRVVRAVPYAVGDSYRGFRVVGTSAEMLADLPLRESPVYAVRAPDAMRAEAALGATVARETGLAENSRFHPQHGVGAGAVRDEHEEEYVVTAVLEPTGTPLDRVIWVPIEGVFRMGGHVLRGSGEEYHPEAGEEIPDESKEVSAVLLELASPQAGFQLQQEINRQGDQATLAWPIATVMAEIFRKLGWVNSVLELVAYLVMLVAAASILASIYNSMNERRRELAVLRALGARRRTIFGVIVLEAATIAGLGAFLGFAVYLAIATLAAGVIRDRTGVVLDVAALHPAMLWTPLGALALGALAGVLPAWKAYSTDVAAHLAANA